MVEKENIHYVVPSIGRFFYTASSRLWTTNTLQYGIKEKNQIKEYTMAERKTREESLKAKLAKNAEVKAKLQEKMAVLDAEEADLQQKLADLKDDKKKAARAAEAKAKREAKKKAEKELMKAINKSGLSAEEVMAKLGI